MEKNKEKIIVVKNLTVKYGLKQQPIIKNFNLEIDSGCLLYTSPSPRDLQGSRMPSSA